MSQTSSISGEKTEACKTLQTIAMQIDAFERECELESYTDTEKSWELLYCFRELANSVLNSMQTK